MIQKTLVCDVFVGDSVCFANRWWSVIAVEQQSGSGEIKLTLELNKVRIIQLFHSSVFLPCEKGAGKIKPALRRSSEATQTETKSQEKALDWLIKAKEVTEQRATLRQQKRRNKRKIGGENDVDS